MSAIALRQIRKKDAARLRGRAWSMLWRAIRSSSAEVAAEVVSRCRLPFGLFLVDGGIDLDADEGKRILDDDGKLQICGDCCDDGGGGGSCQDIGAAISNVVSNVESSACDNCTNDAPNSFKLTVLTGIDGTWDAAFESSFVPVEGVTLCDFRSIIPGAAWQITEWDDIDCGGNPPNATTCDEDVEILVSTVQIDPDPPNVTSLTIQNAAQNSCLAERTIVFNSSGSTANGVSRTNTNSCPTPTSNGATGGTVTPSW